MAEMIYFLRSKGVLKTKQSHLHIHSAKFVVSKILALVVVPLLAVPYAIYPFLACKAHTCNGVACTVLACMMRYELEAGCIQHAGTNQLKLVGGS
jgi:hypothetical protein